MEGKQEDSDYLRGIERPIGRQLKKIRFDRASSYSLLRAVLVAPRCKDGTKALAAEMRRKNTLIFIVGG